MNSNPDTIAVSQFTKGDDFEQLRKEEKAFLSPGREKRRQGDSDKEFWTGIALSGGGIRSATFCLGVLQALASGNVFRKFDYISSVSGGGYLGSSLQWWWSEARRMEEEREKKKTADPTPVSLFGTNESDFPYDTAHFGAPGAPPDNPLGKAQKLNLSYLRTHASYLTPGSGLNIWSLVAVVLRTVLLSLVIWAPLLILGFLTLEMINTWLANEVRALVPSHFATFVQKFVEIKPTEQKCSNCAFNVGAIYVIFLWLYALAVAAFIAMTVAFGLVSRATNEAGKMSAVITAACGLALVAGAVLYLRTFSRSDGPDDITLIVTSVMAAAAVLCFARFAFGIFGPHASNWSYGLRYVLEWVLGNAFVPTLLCLFVGLIPVLPYYLWPHLTSSSGGATAAGVSLVSAISGTASALYGYYTLVKKVEPGLAGRIFAPLGAAIFIYGLLTLSYVAAVYTFEAYTAHDTNLIANKSLITALTLGVPIAIGIAFLLSVAANVNYVGLHRFYRDRLMEAFMPIYKAVKWSRSSPSYTADRLQLSDIRSWQVGVPSGTSEPTPYPIINTLAILPNDENPKVAGRGGDNFVLTPLFVGSKVTGWESAASHARRYGTLSLASAMAASGAAINSNAGYIGTGVTRDRLVSVVMTLLNMRLGMWIGNPAPTRFSTKIPTFLRPLISGMIKGLFSKTQQRYDGFVELSDGGNFDNLGLYELARRKLDVIVVVDGEADARIGLPAFVSAVERIQDDFETFVDFIPQKGPERLVPVKTATVAYPADVSFAQSPFLVAKLRYADGKSGILIYVKATMIENLSFVTSGYRAQWPDFPHQTTADQFFDPAQFEAYRDLRYRSAQLMNDKLKLTSSISPNSILSNY